MAWTDPQRTLPPISALGEPFNTRLAPQTDRSNGGSHVHHSGSTAFATHSYSRTPLKRIANIPYTLSISQHPDQHALSSHETVRHNFQQTPNLFHKYTSRDSNYIKIEPEYERSTYECSTTSDPYTRPPTTTAQTPCDNEKTADEILAEKRRRNAGASARFRDRRKQRQLESDQKIAMLSDQVDKLRNAAEDSSRVPELQRKVLDLKREKEAAFERIKSLENEVQALQEVLQHKGVPASNFRTATYTATSTVTNHAHSAFIGQGFTNGNCTSPKLPSNMGSDASIEISASEREGARPEESSYSNYNGAPRATVGSNLHTKTAFEPSRGEQVTYGDPEIIRNRLPVPNPSHFTYQPIPNSSHLAFQPIQSRNDYDPRHHHSQPIPHLHPTNQDCMQRTSIGAERRDCWAADPEGLERRTPFS